MTHPTACSECRRVRNRATALRRIALHAIQLASTHHPGRAQSLTDLVAMVGHDPTPGHVIRLQLTRADRHLLARVHEGKTTVIALGGDPQETLGNLTRLALRGLLRPHQDGTWTLAPAGRRRLTEDDA